MPAGEAVAEMPRPGSAMQMAGLIMPGAIGSVHRSDAEKGPISHGAKEFFFEM